MPAKTTGLLFQLKFSYKQAAGLNNSFSELEFSILLV